MSEWKLVRLGDIININPESITRDYSYKNILYIDISSIGSGEIQEDIRFVPIDNAPSRAKRIVRDGDTIISTVRPNRRSFLYIKNPPENMIVSTGFAVLRASSAIDPRFLYYIVTNQSFTDYLVANAHGSAYPAVNTDIFENASILLPSLSEQRAIAEMLSSLDDKIEANRRENETLEATARAIFKSWFVDFDPVHAKSRGELPAGMDEETAQLFPDSFVESELGLIPQGWEIKRLDEIATYLNGLALQKYPAENDTDFLPIIKIRELRQGITDASSHRASNAIPSAYIIRDGDVLFSWSGSLLVDLWAGGDGALNQHLFKVNSADYPRWLYYFWTLFYLDEFIQIAEDKATTMGHIKRQHLSEARVVVPNLDVISSLTKFLEPYLEAVVNNRIASRTLAETRDALLPKLMNGELHIIKDKENAKHFIEIMNPNKKLAILRTGHKDRL